MIEILETTGTADEVEELGCPGDWSIVAMIISGGHLLAQDTFLPVLFLLLPLHLLKHLFMTTQVHVKQGKVIVGSLNHGFQLSHFSDPVSINHELCNVM